MEAENCIHYRPPIFGIDPDTDEAYDSIALCELVDKYCLLEQGNDCVCYLEEDDV